MASIAKNQAKTLPSRCSVVAIVPLPSMIPILAVRCWAVAPIWAQSEEGEFSLENSGSH
jgi:hypothetical protein